MKVRFLLILLCLAFSCAGEIPSEGKNPPRFGISLQPYKYNMAYNGRAPYFQADLITKKDGKWNFWKFSWLGILHESECYGCQPGAPTPNIDEIRMLRFGWSRRFLAKERGFSFFHEPGINFIRWYWRNSEYMRLGNDLKYLEDREEFEFIGLQPIEYGGIQWYYKNFLVSLSLGVGLNMGINEYKMTGISREPSRITVPVSHPDYRFISGDINFGIGYAL